MVNLEAVEAALQAAVKDRNQVKADTLRALKTRIQNEQIATGSSLDEVGVLALVQSEAKKRKEAGVAFREAGRTEQADKEEAELAVLAEFLPEQASEDEIMKVIEEKAGAAGWTAKDFGAAMGALKAHFGNTADGGVIAKLLKQKLN